MIALACGAVATAGCGGDGNSDGVPAEDWLVEAVRDQVTALNADLAAQRREVVTASEVGPRAPPVSEVGERPPGPSYGSSRVLPGDEVELRTKPGGSDRRHARRRDRVRLASGTSGSRSAAAAGSGCPRRSCRTACSAGSADDASVLQLFETPYCDRRPTSPIAGAHAPVREARDRALRGRASAAPGSPTPPGAYSVTDGLAGRGEPPLLRLLRPRADRPPAEPAARLDRRRPHRDSRDSGRCGVGAPRRAACGPPTQTWSRFCPGVPLGAPVFIRP